MRARPRSPVDAVGAERLHDLGAHPQQRVERCHRVLVDHGDLGRRGPSRRLFSSSRRRSWPAKVIVPPSNRTGGSGSSWSTESMVRLLPEPLSPDDADLLARQDLEVDAVDDLAVVPVPAGADANMAQAQQGFARWVRSSVAHRERRAISSSTYCGLRTRRSTRARPGAWPAPCGGSGSGAGPGVIEPSTVACGAPVQEGTVAGQPVQREEADQGEHERLLGCFGYAEVVDGPRSGTPGSRRSSSCHQRRVAGTAAGRDERRGAGRAAGPWRPFRPLATVSVASRSSTAMSLAVGQPAARYNRG